MISDARGSRRRQFLFPVDVPIKCWADRSDPIAFENEFGVARKVVEQGKLKLFKRDKRLRDPIAERIAAADMASAGYTHANRTSRPWSPQPCQSSHRSIPRDAPCAGKPTTAPWK